MKYNALYSKQFPISTSVDITVYLHGKRFYISFINRTKMYKFTSMDERREIFRVYIELCRLNTVLYQSVFRIHKCYIINQVQHSLSSYGNFF